MIDTSVRQPNIRCLVALEIVELCQDLLETSFYNALTQLLARQSSS